MPSVTGPKVDWPASALGVRVSPQARPHCAGATRHEKQILIPSVIVDKKFLNLLELSSSGSNSAVECQLPKLDVAGSIPVSRSIFSITYRNSDLRCTPKYSIKRSAALIPASPRPPFSSLSQTEYKCSGLHPEYAPAGR